MYVCTYCFKWLLLVFGGCEYNKIYTDGQKSKSLCRPCRL